MDVDSTVWDTAARVREAAREVTGAPQNLQGFSTWTHVLEAYGEEATAKIFDLALSPEKVGDRTPYPGAAETLRRLQEEAGVAVHFVTRGHDPEAMGPRLHGWLREHFGPAVGLTFAAGGKLEVLRSLRAFGLVDDRPETLASVADAGLWAATKLQPWNRDLVAARPDVCGFDDWREFPDPPPG